MAGSGDAALKEQTGTKQASFEAFLLKMEQQFEWLRNKLDPNCELPYPLDPKDDSSFTPPLPIDLHNRSILGTPVGLAIRAENTFPKPAEIGESNLPMVHGIKPADLELREIKMEVDLKDKDNRFIEVSNEPKSKVYKFGSSMLIIEDSGDRAIKKIDDSHSNSTIIFQNKANYVKNRGVVVLNPLGNGSVLVQKLLYSKCSNYNAKESLDRWILKLAKHGTIAIGVNDSMMNSERGVTTEVYTTKALQGRGEYEFVHDPRGVLFINNMSLISYMKIQLKLVIKFFFFEQCLIQVDFVLLRVYPHFNP
ncbi:hypothetical protein LguiA_031501 [Lonicera macranthoides]